MKLCPLCGNKAIHRFKLAHTIVWKCTLPDCGLEFAHPQLDATDLARAYTDFYYPADGGCSVVRYEETPDSVLHQVFLQLEGQIGSLRGRKLLDYGCGPGGLLRVAELQGLLSVGIEPDPKARSVAEGALGVLIFPGIKEMLAQESPPTFDLIFMWNVIEHLRLPWDDLCKLCRVLRPDGWLVVSTMNVRCMRARLERAHWENYKNPTHLYYFDRSSLRRVLQAAGYGPIREWKLRIQYPHHGMLRRRLHLVTAALGLADGVVYLCQAKVQPLKNGLLSPPLGQEISLGPNKS